MKIKKPRSSTKERILHAALKLFSQKGYLGATTREIAAIADVAELTLFRCFVSKEQLLEEVIGASAFLPAMDGVFSEALEMPYEKALLMIAERCLQIFNRRRDLIKIMHWEMERHARGRKKYYSLLKELMITQATYFREMQRRGLLEQFDAENGARAFVGMLFLFFNMEQIGAHNRYGKNNGMASITDCVRIFARGTLAFDPARISRINKETTEDFMGEMEMYSQIKRADNL